MKPDPTVPNRRWWFTAAIVLAAVIALWAVNTYVVSPLVEPQSVSYSELIERVHQGDVTHARIEQNRVVAELKPASQGAKQGAKPKSIVATRLPGIDEDFLYKDLASHGVQISGEISTSPWWQGLLIGWMLPLGLLLLLWSWGFKRLGQRGPISFGRSGAKIYDRTAGRPTTFADVAGAEEAKSELFEVVDLLKSPARYRAIGARMPKGVLLVGEPGTGKTLLARAIAGEAGVPFFSISGSEFVELFVGLGAARIRNLFEQAKERAPCIVFIDEIDAIGKSRAGAATMASHDEREQTLNQLLVEMDGFEENAGVILMAATNRPELLDPALVRAGRFDRQVIIERPDVAGRRAILELHARRLHLGEGVDMALLARRTPGMVGADLANVVNEGALSAARRNATVVEQRDFEEGLDRVMLGLAKVGAALSDEEKRRVAVHEAGHAVVARSLVNADPVHRVSIVPRTIGALGMTLQLPEQERKLVTQDELEDRLTVLLAGRASEEAILGVTSTGSADDIEKATAIARDMVMRYGMEAAVGPVSYAPPPLRFLAGIEMPERHSSEAFAARIDEAVRAALEGAQQRAEQIVSSRRPLLDALITKLLEKETLYRDDLAALWSAFPSPAPGAAPAPRNGHDREARDVP